MCGWWLLALFVSVIWVGGCILDYWELTWVVNPSLSSSSLLEGKEGENIVGRRAWMETKMGGGGSMFMYGKSIA